MQLPRGYRRNALSNYLNAIVTLLLAILVTPILVRGLGKEAYGTWILVTSTVLFLDLLQFGVGEATVRYVAHGVGLRDPDRVRRTVATSFFALCAPALLVLATTPALVLLFPKIFHVHGDLRVAAMVLVALSVFDLAIGMPASTFGATLVGFQRYDLMNAFIAGQAFVRASAWTAILALGGGLIAIGTVAIVLHVLAEIAMYRVARRLLAGPPIERRKFDRTLVRPLLSLSGWLSVAQFGSVLISRLDAAIVGVVAGVPQAGIYAVGAKLAAVSGTFTFPAVSVFFPYAADLAASGDENAIREAVYTGTRIALGIATPLTIAAALLAKPALRVWVGPGFDDAALVVVYLSAALLLGTLSGTGISILRGMGDAKIPALIVLLEGAVNLGLSVGLGLSMGMVGVALATLIASGLSQAVRLPYVCRRTGVSLVSLLHAVGRTNLVPGAVALSLGLVLRGLRLSGIVEVFAAGCAIVATYTLVMLVTGLSPEERRGLFAFVARRVDVNPPAG